MEKTTQRIIIGVIVLAGAVAIFFAWQFARESSKPPQLNWANIYDADTPPFETTAVDARLILLTPEVLAKAPVADVFTSPLGSEWGAFAYDAQPFGEENGLRGGKHYGKDYNGIGGMNTDLGDPVYAAARGKVIYCGEPSDGWGKVIVLLHRLPDGTFLQTLYAHLDTSNVYYGELVPRGKKIGTVGTANGNYPAHLHFEMIESIANEAGMAAYGKETANRIDPQTVFAKYPPGDNTLMPDPLNALQKNQYLFEELKITIEPPEDAKQTK